MYFNLFLFLLLQCCIQLASNKLTPDQLTPDIMELLANQPPRRLMGQLHMPEEGGAKSSIAVEIFKMLHQLSDRAVNVQNCCHCIVTCFKIANVSIIISSNFCLKL